MTWRMCIEQLRNFLQQDKINIIILTHCDISWKKSMSLKKGMLLFILNHWSWKKSRKVHSQLKISDREDFCEDIHWSFFNFKLYWLMDWSTPSLNGNSTIEIIVSDYEFHPERERSLSIHVLMISAVFAFPFPPLVSRSQFAQVDAKCNKSTISNINQCETFRLIFFFCFTCSMSTWPLSWTNGEE